MRSFAAFKKLWLKEHVLVKNTEEDKEEEEEEEKEEEATAGTCSAGLPRCRAGWSRDWNHRCPV